jgi:hypothetical protein
MRPHVGASASARCNGRRCGLADVSIGWGLPSRRATTEAIALPSAGPSQPLITRAGYVRRFGRGRALHRDCRGEDSPRGRSVRQSLVIGRRLSVRSSRPTVTERRRQLPLVRRVSADPAIPHAYDETSKPVRPRRSGSSLPCPKRHSNANALSPDQSQSALVGLDPAFYRCHAVGYAGAPRTRGQGERVRPNEGRSPALPRARRHVPPKLS